MLQLPAIARESGSGRSLLTKNSAAGVLAMYGAVSLCIVSRRAREKMLRASVTGCHWLWVAAGRERNASGALRGNIWVRIGHRSRHASRAGKTEYPEERLGIAGTVVQT